jgi:hypothetical protein
MPGQRLKPNSMQVGFIKNLKTMIKEGKKRALLISATGERVIIVIRHRRPEDKRLLAA